MPRSVFLTLAVWLLLALGIGVYALVEIVARSRALNEDSPSLRETAHESPTNSVPQASAASELSSQTANAVELEKDLSAQWRRAIDIQNCEAALELAHTITEKLPGKSSGWVMLAYSLHELGRSEDAFHVLSNVVEKFPTEYLPAYNVACYACKTGKLEDARRWLRRSAEIAGAQFVRTNALKDLDLEPLWEEIKGW